MKVFHIITGLNDGGAEAVLYRLVCKDGPCHHHVISMMDEGKYGPLLRQAGATVVCLNMPRGRIVAGALFRLWRLLRLERPDVVQTWMYHADLIGGIVSRLACTARVCWGIRHTTLDRRLSAGSTILVARLNALLSRWIPHVIVCCAEKAQEVHAGMGYATNKLVVIPNGYDLHHFIPNLRSRRRVRGELGVRDDAFLIGMVGRFDPQKDHANLIQALARLRQLGADFHCVLVGAGVVIDNTHLSDLINDHGLGGQVCLLGQRTDLPDLMAALDLHILSSSYGEAFPNVLAEAMACGVACVTTDVGDAEMIVGDTGWVVPARDSQALAEAIAAASNERITRPGDWEHRKMASRQRIASHFSLERMQMSYIRIWEG